MFSTDKPEVNLSLGQELDPDHIKEGNDVYFDCTIISNPKVHHVTWYHNVSVLYNVSLKKTIFTNVFHLPLKMCFLNFFSFYI